MGDYRPPTWQKNCGPQPPETWTLTLNRYQRDNLLLLLNAVGYPFGTEHMDPDLARYNTGDWVGEIVLMLAKTFQGDDHMMTTPSMTIDEHDRPNKPHSRAS